MFDVNGARLEGDERIEVLVHRTDKEGVWFYQVKRLKDYVFVNMPVVPVHTDYGIAKNEGISNARADIFRYITSPLENFSTNGGKNLSVNFCIVGYKPKQLLSRLEAK